LRSSRNRAKIRQPLKVNASLPIIRKRLLFCRLMNGWGASSEPAPKLSSRGP
jgi:hypothetical protein